jgi:hypothetical protein
MDHNVMGPLANHLDIAFSNCILVLGSNPGEGLGLVLGDAIFTEHACIVDSIIAVIGPDGYTGKIPTHLLK